MIRERKSTRLSEFDYAQAGHYFVTVCSKNREEWLGGMESGKVQLNQYGKIVEMCWNDLPNHYENCLLDEFVIMPNHFHGIVVIRDINDVGNGFKPFPTKQHGLSEIIRGFKTFSSRRINESNNHNRFQWQKSFHDHVIRNEQSLYEIRKYIQENPLKWELDNENPRNMKDVMVGTGLKPAPTTHCT